MLQKYLPQDAEVFALFEERKLKGQKKVELKGVMLQKALEGRLALKLPQYKSIQGIDVSDDKCQCHPIVMHF